MYTAINDRKWSGEKSINNSSSNKSLCESIKFLSGNRGNTILRVIELYKTFTSKLWHKRLNTRQV